MNIIINEKDHISFFADYHSPERHSHFAKHLIFSGDGFFHCTVNDYCFHCTGVCIGSGAVHTVEHKGGDLFVMLIEETSFLSQILEYRYLLGKPYAVIRENPLKDVQQIEEADSKVLNLCAPDIRTEINYDKRIVKALFEIDSCESIDTHTISKLCSVVHLSQSRLSHLFRDQVKTPLSSYLVLAKMKKVLFYIKNGENITAASVHAGFNSPSHYAATCKKMFGISFSDALK